MERIKFFFSGGDGDPSGGFMMMAMAWMVMAMMMYFMRPNSLRGEPQGKPQGTFFGATNCQVIGDQIDCVCNIELALYCAMYKLHGTLMTQL